MKKMGITLVTAFFDIGRGNLENKFLQRSTEKYFSYFKHWARMKNDLVVYTETRFMEDILKIRKEYGLEDYTKVIGIDSIFEVQADVYHRMCQIEKREDFRKYRYYENAYSNIAKYDYIMLMKYWVLADTEKKGLINTDMMAWIDFGFDHGGKLFPNHEEFSFQLSYSFSKKIHLFALYHPDELSGADSLQLLCDCIMGAPLYVPTDMAEPFWKLILNNMQALLNLDCIDDDQQLLLMAYKENPKWFEIHISDWFLPLKEYGGEHLTVRAKTNVRERAKLVGKFRKMLRQMCGKTGQQDFSRRCYRRAKRYYPD